MPLREGYVQLNVAATDIKSTIFNHPEYQAFATSLADTYTNWLQTQAQRWLAVGEGSNLKELIAQMSEDLLQAFADNPLVSNYDLYQHLMSYWQEVMQDDLYIISLDGWKAGNEWNRQVIKGKTGKDGKAGKDKEVAGLAGVQGRLIAAELLAKVYFEDLQTQINAQEQVIESAQASLTEIEEEQSSEDGLFADLEKVNATEVGKLLKQLQPTKKAKAAAKHEYAMVAEPEAVYETKSSFDVLEEYVALAVSIKKANAEIKKLQAELEKAVTEKYAELSEEEIKDLLVNQKWTAHLQSTLLQEQDKISQALTQRINALAERYATTLGKLEAEVLEASNNVKSHLEKMGWVW